MSSIPNEVPPLFPTGSLRAARHYKPLAEEIQVLVQSLEQMTREHELELSQPNVVHPSSTPPTPSIDHDPAPPQAQSSTLPDVSAGLSVGQKHAMSVMILRLRNCIEKLLNESLEQVDSHESAQMKNAFIGHRELLAVIDSCLSDTSVDDSQAKQTVSTIQPDQLSSLASMILSLSRSYLARLSELERSDQLRLEIDPKPSKFKRIYQQAKTAKINENEKQQETETEIEIKKKGGQKEEIEPTLSNNRRTGQAPNHTPRVSHQRGRSVWVAPSAAPGPSRMRTRQTSMSMVLSSTDASTIMKSVAEEDAMSTSSTPADADADNGTTTDNTSNVATGKVDSISASKWSRLEHQGSAEMYLPSNLLRRELHLFEEEIVELTKLYWRTCFILPNGTIRGATARGQSTGTHSSPITSSSPIFRNSINSNSGSDGILIGMSKSTYLHLFTLAHLLLKPHHTAHDAQQVVAMDWMEDVGMAAHPQDSHHTLMSLAQFHLGLFNLVDTWTESVGLEEYVAFLRNLFVCITLELDGGRSDEPTKSMSEGHTRATSVSAMYPPGSVFRHRLRPLNAHTIILLRRIGAHLLEQDLSVAQMDLGLLEENERWVSERIEEGEQEVLEEWMGDRDGDRADGHGEDGTTVMRPRGHVPRLSVYKPPTPRAPKAPATETSDEADNNTVKARAHRRARSARQSMDLSTSRPRHRRKQSSIHIHAGVRSSSLHTPASTLTSNEVSAPPSSTTTAPLPPTRGDAHPTPRASAHPPHMHSPLRAAGSNNKPYNKHSPSGANPAGQSIRDRGGAERKDHVEDGDGQDENEGNMTPPIPGMLFPRHLLNLTTNDEDEDSDDDDDDDDENGAIEGSERTRESVVAPRAHVSPHPPSSPRHRSPRVTPRSTRHRHSRLPSALGKLSWRRPRHMEEADTDRLLSEAFDIMRKEHEEIRRMRKEEQQRREKKMNALASAAQPGANKNKAKKHAAQLSTNNHATHAQCADDDYRTATNSEQKEDAAIDEDDDNGDAKVDTWRPEWERIIVEEEDEDESKVADEDPRNDVRCRHASKRKMKMNARHDPRKQQTHQFEPDELLDAQLDASMKLFDQQRMRFERESERRIQQRMNRFRELKRQLESARKCAPMHLDDYDDRMETETKQPVVPPIRTGALAFPPASPTVATLTSRHEKRLMSEAQRRPASASAIAVPIRSSPHPHADRSTVTSGHMRTPSCPSSMLASLPSRVLFVPLQRSQHSTPQSHSDETRLIPHSPRAMRNIVKARRHRMPQLG